MLERLAKLMGRVRQVTDDIAHDLRARLRQRLEIARKKASTIGEYQRAVDGAIEAADAIIATFASLLRIAEVKAGERRSAFRVTAPTAARSTPSPRRRGQDKRHRLPPRRTARPNSISSSHPPLSRSQIITHAGQEHCCSVPTMGGNHNWRCGKRRGAASNAWRN